MKAEQFIRHLIEKYDNPTFEYNSEWWEGDNYDTAHAHGVEEGMQFIIDELKTFNTK